MNRTTNLPTASTQLETIDNLATQRERTQFTGAKKANSARRPGCHLESKRPPAKSTNMDEKIQAWLDIMDSQSLRQFLASVAQEPEVREVLASPSGRSNLPQGSCIYAMRTVALVIRQQFPFSEIGRDIVYVAALLHGIQHGLASCVLGNADLNDVMFTIVRGPLHRLDDSDPGSASFLRLCMGWGNSDENVALVEQLRKTLLRASRSMDRVNSFAKGN